MSKLIAVGMQSKYSCLSSWRHGGQCNSLQYSWSTELLPWPGTGLETMCLCCHTDPAVLALADIGHRSLVIILSLSRPITPSQSLSQLSSLRQTKDIKDKWYFWVFKIFRIYGGFKTLWCQTYRGPPWPMSPWSVPHRSLVTSTIAGMGPGLGSVPQLSHRIVIFLYNFPHTSLPSLICNFINGL